jgi:Tfp pilus assembly protein PilF
MALGFDPNDTDALFHIAEVATANGNLEKADQAYPSDERILTVTDC